MPVNWFVARKGKKDGPYTLEQLQQLAHSAQLEPGDMVLQEGTTKWSAASAVVDFGVARAPAAAQWFYAQNKQRLGPVSFLTLQDLARGGKLQRTDMVLQVGTQGWAAAGSVADLFPAELPLECNLEGYEVSDSAGVGDVSMPKRPSGAGVKAAAGASLAMLGQGARSIFDTTKDIAAATTNEAKRKARTMALRREIDRLQSELNDKLPRAIGQQLLSNEVRVPGCEQLLTTFGKLNREFTLANQGALTGDKDKKRDAARLAHELDPIYSAYGRAALESPVAFENRAECLQRRDQLAKQLADRKAELEGLEKDWQSASKGRKRHVLVGFGAAAAVLLLVFSIGAYVVVKGLASSSSGEQARQNTQPESTSKPSGARKPMKELFASMSPSVALIEATGTGSGSGFLVEHQGQLRVITNRHVVEDASQGIVLHFMKGTGTDNRLTIPKEQVTVVAVHKQADLAIIDVSKASNEIRRWKIEPLALAPRAHVPTVGEHVFAIGHPSDGDRGVLAHTLTDGTVSAVGRKYDNASFMQVQVPLNPGNSGGPLFDDDGRVIGVNTFVIRKGRGRDVALEGLNFSLEVNFVHELLNDRSKSMDEAGIAEVLGKRPANPMGNLASDVQGMVKRWLGMGFRPLGGPNGRNMQVVRVPANANRTFRINFMRGKEYGIGTISQGTDDIDLAVADQEGVLASDEEADATPAVRFTARRTGSHTIVVSNPTDQDGIVVLVVFEK
ncbi:MAG: trypsin-like peptidase domain-containing protein [Gemmataceae bacterium]|nr:trypsin-like peptidase domain-containing protein [Gemmataceae bacterium]